MNAYVAPTFRLQFHTSKRIDTASVVEGAITAVETLSGRRPEYVCYLGKSNRTQVVPFDARTFERIAREITCALRFGVAGTCELKHSAESATYLAVFNWVYPKQSSLDEFIDLRGFPQNVVTIEIPVEVLRSSGAARALVEVGGKFASLVHANYGRGWCHEHEIGRPVARNRGLMSGLPNSYWLNIFGHPFVELIGGNKLDQLPHSYEHGGIRIVLAAENYDLDDLLAVQRSRETLRNAIGPQFFAKTEVNFGGASVANGSGMLQFFTSVLRDRKQFRSKEGDAEAKAKIDWTLFEGTSP